MAALRDPPFLIVRQFLFRNSIFSSEMVGAEFVAPAACRQVFNAHFLAERAPSFHRVT